MAATETGLRNSTRRFDKVSYTPIQITPDSEPEPSIGALNLAALLRTLKVAPDELKVGDPSQQPSAAAAAMDRLIGAVSGHQAIDAAAALAAVPPAQVASFVGQVGQARAAAARSVASAVAALRDAHVQAVTDTARAPAPAPEPPRIRLAAASTPPATAAPPAGTQSAEQHPADTMPATAAAVPPPPILASDTVAWAEQAQPRLLDGVRSAAGPYLAAPLRSAADLDLLVARLDRGARAADVVMASLTQRALQPIGLLHLERLDMTPIAIERGELVYSLPLAPHEKVTLAHREWTTHETEFQQYVQDYQENFSQQGVAQSDDISMATQAQSSHANELSMGSQPTSTTPATITAAVPSSIAGSTVEDQTSQTTSRDQSRTVTALASARTIKDQKISFTVTTTSGVEDFTARVIENPHDDVSLRIDYYRRMRRWRSELCRYGVRMTYDVVLPDPGQLLRGRVDQIRDIEGKLSQPFTMTLAPSALTPATWQYFGDLYGVALSAPADQSIRITATKVVGYDPPVTTTTTPGASWVQAHFSEDLSVAIPDGYVLSALHVDLEASTWITGVGAQWITVIANDVVQNVDAGASGFVIASLDVPIGSLPTKGAVSVAFRLKGIMTGQLAVTATAVPSASTTEQWRQQAWSALRAKAYADYLANLDRLRQQRSSLVSDLNNTDALTLRRLEREQIMRATLEWLFPGFGDAGSVLEGLPDPGSLDATRWQRVMQYGEYIKFVQSAIDWDNVLVLLYPYFWDTLAQQQEKLLLSHPDPLHRDFLRAGAARVILAIQPGFEEQVVSLLQQGQFGTLGEGTAFAKIAQDVQIANATYEQGTQPSEANPDNPHPGGVLIGLWHDYTPTGALDIDVTKFPVLDGTKINPAGP